MKAKIKGTEVLILDYGFRNLIEENPHSNFDDRFSLEEWFNSTEACVIDGCELVDVVRLPPPEYNSLTQKVLQSETPTVSNGQVIYAWTVLEKTAEELAAQENINSAIPAVNGFVPGVQE